MSEIYGLHAAEAALRNPARSISAIKATENALNKLADALERPDLPGVETVTPRQLDRLLGPDTVHQGILVSVSALEPMTLERVCGDASQTNRPLIILDQVTDPHNVGAILRSAVVFGAAGLIMTWRHSPPLDGALAKAASGALEAMPVVRVRNLAKSLEALEDCGIQSVGLDGAADLLLDELPVAEKPTAFVLGAEGKGLRDLTRRTCSTLCRIGTDGPIASLNVSNAAAVALHMSAMQRRRKLS